jgi:four helix bundle protein
MNKIHCFEDLIVWQKARALNVKVYQFTLNETFSKDFGLKNQIRNASVSISSNIAEGFERNGNKEFSQFLSIAKGSAGEVRSQLYLAKDLEYIPEKNFQTLVDDLTEISKMLNGLIRYLKETELKGSKFMEEEVEYERASLFEL